MKTIKLFFGVIILSFSLYFVYFQYKKTLVSKKGKEIVIKKEDFSIPINCDFLNKDSSKFLKFIYKGNEYSLRITSKQCFEIQNLKELKLIKDEKNNVFVLNDSNLYVELYFSIILFLILFVIFYKIILKPYVINEQQ